MFSDARILIVGSSVENRDVLCTLFERLGAKTFETPRTRHAGQLTRRSQPDLIVYEPESSQAPTSEAVDDLEDAAAHNSAPIVVLGTKNQYLSRLATGHFVPKPYHYATVIRRIEEILGNRTEAGLGFKLKGNSRR